MPFPPTLPPRKSFKEVWLITIGHSLTHWYPATFYLLLPLIGNELGLSYLQIGSILTTQALAGAISNIPGGLFVDSVGRKGLLMAVSLFWIGAPYLLMGFSHDYWLLLTCAALVGIGNNLWHPTAIPLLAQRYPDRKGLVVSIHGMGGNVGDALAPLVAGAMLAVLSWREVVVINVIPGIVMSVVLLVMLGRTLNTDGPAAAGKAPAPKRTLADTLRDFKPLLANRTLIFLCAGSVFRSMTHGGLLTFLPLYLATDMGYSPIWIGAAMAALQTAGFIACPIAGHLSDKMGRRQIVMSSMAMTAVIIAAMIVAGGIERFRVLRRVPRVLLLLDPGGAAGLAARCDAVEHGRLVDRHAVRAPVVRLGARPADLRPDRRPLRPDHDVLFPGRHHHRRQHADLLHAGRRPAGRREGALRRPAGGVAASA